MEPIPGAPSPSPPPSTQKPTASSRAMAALILGILSCLFLGLLTGIPAWILGHKEVKAIDRGEAPVEGRTAANVGRILGIIGTFLWCLFGLLIQIFFGVFLLMGVKT